MQLDYTFIALFLAVFGPVIVFGLLLEHLVPRIHSWSHNLDRKMRENRLRRWRRRTYRK